jgi:hypothetical protein
MAPSSAEATLRLLMEDVERARAAYVDARDADNTQPRSTSAAACRARGQLLVALEAYAAALNARGGTMPHRLALELNLYRLLGSQP